MSVKIDLIGKRFGRLVVAKENGRNKDGIVLWECRCGCGSMKIIAGSSLRRGFTKSCGCLALEAITKHGMKGTPTYETWENMKRRCSDKTRSDYKNYGGRGINVCKEWLKFEGFFSDMGVKPDGLTLERKNNNLGYFKENCCWASRTVQSRNKRIPRNNKTGVKGIVRRKHSQKYHAYITVNSKKIYLGSFGSIVNASEARNRAELKYWGKNNA